MLVSHKRLLVEWGDFDPAGIVFYPRYLSGLTIAPPPSFSRPACRFKTFSARTAFSAFRSST